MNFKKEIQIIYSDPDLYNAEFHDYNDDIYFWENIIKEYNCKNVLELGTGTGRIAKTIIDSVDKYNGIEISKEYINSFKKEKKYIINKDKITIEKGDICKLKLNSKYEMIILPFNIFFHVYTIDDIKNFFTELNKKVDRNTIIVIDILNPNLDHLTKKEEFLCKTFKDKNNNQIYLYEKHFYDNVNQIIRYTKRYFYPHICESIVTELPVRVYFPVELDNLIKLFKFEILEKYGDYDKSKFDLNSRKQILIIKKKENLK